MHKLTFHPLGNADCTRIDLEGGKKFLMDYADMRDDSNPDDKRIDLPAALKADLLAAGRNYYDTVAFTHLDDDHIHGASEFFYFDWATKYQSDERVRINELWVPAAAILETAVKGDKRVIQEEAKHRLLNKYGIRIFSSPNLLDDWLRRRGKKPEDFKDFITNAGEIVPGYTTARDGVEFFCHSPFATRSEQGKLLDRNNDALALHATILSGGRQTRTLFLSDLDYDVIADIVNVTEYQDTKHPGRIERLWWDIQKISHHCSYNALGPDKGTHKTEPAPSVDRLFRTYGQQRGIIVSTSKPIPANDDDDQPPHRQAASYYCGVADAKSGQFIVTMKHPNEISPKPLIIKIDGFGPTVEKVIAASVTPIVSRPAPRAGESNG